jgi:hypothetical protein
MGFDPSYLASSPTSSWGYYRGTPYYGGDGSGMGQNVAGNSAFASGQGVTSDTGWEPSIPFLLGFIVLEMVIFAYLGRKL